MADAPTESYDKVLNRIVNPNVNPKAMTTLSQNDIAKQIQGQEELGRRSLEYDNKMREFKRRQSLIQKVIDLRRQLTAAEHKVQELNKKPEPIPEKKKKIEYTVELVDGKIIRKEIEIRGGKE